MPVAVSSLRRNPRRSVAALVAVCSAAGLAVAAPASAAFRFTHKVTVSGKVTDSWTRTAISDCGRQGGGSRVIVFAWATAQKTRPTRVPSDRWKLVIPFNEHRGTLIRDLDPQRARGSITYVNNAVPVGSDCQPDPGDTSGCGTRALNQTSSLVGADLRNLEFSINLPNFGSVHCLGGEYDSFAGPPFAPARVLLRMPSPRSLAHRRITVLHRRFTGQLSDDSAGDRLNETVTTELVVTFTRLRR
jgi:hypothetical protein